MKKTLTTFTLIFFSLFSFSQTIFPDDIKKVVTDENLSENKILKFNDFYLSNLDFKKINDTLYSDNKTKETISITSFKQANKVYSIINYFTVGNHWDDFEKGLKDFKITNITAKTFIAEYKDYKDYKIELLEDSLVQNNKLKHLRFSFAYEKAGELDKPFFPIKTEYPFHYSVWYFDVKLKPEQNKTYFPTIFLKKEKTNKKIEFLDKNNILISYVDENNILQKIKGRYTVYGKNTAHGGSGIFSQIVGPSIGFILENSSVILNKLYLHETVNFSKLSSKDFLEFMFHMNYNITKSDSGFIMNSKIELNRPPAPDIKRE